MSENRPNVSRKSLLNLKAIVTQNVTANKNIGKCMELNDGVREIDEEIESKKRKTCLELPNSTDLREYLTKSDLSSRTLISAKEQGNESFKRIVIPRMGNDEEYSDETKHFKRIVIANEEEASLSTNSINEECITQVQHTISSIQTVPSSPPPSEFLDCCDRNQCEESDNSNYWDSFHVSAELRVTMMSISQRLTTTQPLAIVDTHCHFDLIFDRLNIKHNDLKKYFEDYKDFYPSDLSFQLAIQVFWRPRQLTEKNWTNWYSKYLNDQRVYACCGIHPHWSSLWTERTRVDIERCLRHPKVLAIGEIGLDLGPKNTCNINEQARVFIEQLKLAVKWSVPIVIHSRNAYPQTFEMMKQYLQPNHKIHLHCFVGTLADVQLFTSYFHQIKFGFTPIITHGTSLHSVIEQLDLRQILSETDSPYFVPEELAHFSRSAHPGMVYSVVETIAQLRRISIVDVARQLRENAFHLYGV